MLPRKLIIGIVIMGTLALIIAYFLVVPLQEKKETTTYDIIEGKPSGDSKWGYADVDNPNGGILIRAIYKNFEKITIVEKEKRDACE